MNNTRPDTHTGAVAGTSNSIHGPGRGGSMTYSRAVLIVHQPIQRVK